MTATRSKQQTEGKFTVLNALGRTGRALGRLVWLFVGSLAAGCRALYRTGPVQTALSRCRQGLIRLGRGIATGVSTANDWFYRRFGRTLTLGLAGLGFTSFVLVPDLGGLYQGVDWDSDLDCLAMNIYHEARNEPKVGKLAVGHVVMNRVFDRRFPGTVCEVVMQGGQERHNYCQFSWWCDGKDDQPLNQRAWVESQYLASRIFSGSHKDPTGGALWYHADYVNPSWSKTLVQGPQIGRHKFYQRP